MDLIPEIMTILIFHSCTYFFGIYVIFLHIKMVEIKNQTFQIRVFLQMLKEYDLLEIRLYMIRSSLSNSEFIDIWLTLRSGVVSVDSFLSNANHYEKEVNILRYTSMDPLQEQYYRDELAKQYAEEQVTKKHLRKFEGKQFLAFLSCKLT